MIPILYDSNETAFVSNGLCRLKDTISCTVTEERNSIYECDFEYPITGTNYDLIKCGRIIAVTHDETGDIQPFDIVSFSRPINGVVTFHAVHISYRQSKLTVSGTNISSLTDALTLLTTAKPTNPFGYWTDKTSDALFSAADGVPRSVKQMLGGTEGSILDCYGGEYEWDKWTVRLWNARGRAREFTIRYGVNMMSYDEDVDYSDTYTACIPFWTGSGENSESIVITGNMVSSGVVPYNGHEACIPLDLTDKFETQPTSAQLEELAYKLMSDKNVFIPAQTIRVQFTRLQDSPDYENYASLMECSLCDSVNVMFSDYDVSGSFKIVKTTWNVLKDRFDEMELGTLSVTLQSALDTSGTSPSVSDVTIIKTAAEAQNTANIANGILISMDEAAQAANTTLEGIYADAENSKNLLSDMEDAATAAQTTLTGIYADAETAKTQAASALSSASTALTAAQSAQANADAALVSLSNVEDVVGVLEWITAHGTMTANGSTALDPAKVYFIVDANGDYVVGGTHYSIVAEPKDADKTSYYILSVDESVQNYVATHVVVDTEGLWLIPDSGGNKVLIATGAGSSYTTPGTYIIGKVNGVDTVFAKFLQTGVTMNATNSTQIAHLGYGEGNAQSGTANKPYYTIGARRTTTTQYNPTSSYSVGDLCVYNNKVYVCNTDITTAEAWNSSHWQLLIGNNSVAEGSNAVASGYCSHAEGVGTYAIGLGGSHSEGMGTFATGVDGSHAEGWLTKASGDTSHAEGYKTTASEVYSHAEGHGAVANGASSHAQNLYTVANGDYQTALGKYNVADSTSAVILGNGTADNARSNALTIDWNGDVNLKGQAKTSFKSSIAMGSYGSAQTTVPNFIDEVRMSSGCAGSVSIGTAYTKNGVTINAGWYNFMYMPHRSGGVNGSASGDNCNYGNCFLFGMNNTYGRFIIRVSSGSIAEVAQIYTSIERYTRSSAGTLDWSSQADGDAKVIMKSALAFWNGAYNGTGSNLKYSANGEIVGTNTGLGKTTWTPTSGSSYSSYGGCYYEKYGRVVHVHVGVSGLTTGTATVIYTLPSGHRPSTTVFAHGTGGAWNNIGYVEIYSDGRISVRSQGTYCGADITFLA
ncbi:MAG: hypothetical protein IIZ78_02880 [Clostridiales bacterium]|nr:hypothetical protein [Clostridiales bacterium]